MGDPERLLSASSDADDLERELLASVRNVAPPKGAKDEGWAGIAAQLTAAVSAGAAAHAAATSEAGAASAGAAKAGVGSAVGSSGSNMVAGAFAKAVAGKMIIVLALGGSTLGVGAYYLAHKSPPSSSTPPAPNAPAAVPASSAIEAAEPARVEQAVPAPVQQAAPAPVSAESLPRTPGEPATTASTKRADPSARSADSLEAESALLTEARAELRGGDARAAMATLDKLRTQFPKGVLNQEREVLAIEVLAATGDTEGASRKARAFSDAHPNSPHTAKLRRFIIDP
jgi:hypothetical protein